MFTGTRTSSEVASSSTDRGLRGRQVKAMIVALAIAFIGSLFLASTADARLGGGSSFGSRGSRTYSAPSATPTAPSVSPFQRSATPNGGFSSPMRPGGGFFGGGFGRGLIGGFLGAGLFGLLFGHGFTGGLGGGMSLIGLLLQIGLIYLLFRLVMGFFASRNQSAYGNSNPSSFSSGAQTGSGFGGGGLGSTLGAGFQGSPPQGAPITIGPDDYQAFERRLAESQAAYSNGDVGALRRISTPEMAGNFEQELAENDRHGVVNKITDVRLLQGDLSEAWRENGSDYATVAMRFSLIDATVEKGSGRVVAGDQQRPQEVTEVWTFRRPSGAGSQGWALSGIQQA